MDRICQHIKENTKHCKGKRYEFKYKKYVWKNLLDNKSIEAPRVMTDAKKELHSQIYKVFGEEKEKIKKRMTKRDEEGKLIDPYSESILVFKEQAIELNVEYTYFVDVCISRFYTSNKKSPYKSILLNVFNVEILKNLDKNV